MSLNRDRNGELSIKLDGYTIRGKSIGGRETSFIIQELSVVFDMGYQPDKIETIQNAFISHGHADHIGCLHFMYANKKLQHITSPWQLIMPKSYIPSFIAMASASSSCNRGGFPAGFTECYLTKAADPSIQVLIPFKSLQVDKLIPAEECQLIPLIDKNNFLVNSYKMVHKICSYGYIINEQRKKLKEEYKGLSGFELKNLKAQNVIIQDDISISLIAFTGDTTIDGLLLNPDFFQAKILIMECTHFDDSIEDAESHGHIHFQQIIDNIDKFLNKWIILSHFSQKYRSIKDVEPYLKHLPEHQRKRFIMWI
ncbi:MAG: tRNaseZ [Harvfovirus sp.]|uniref:TRNaseZ n=1 Tax=Harvfovirus sp. TaxID=2487768 RepID=A0A3G4ZZN0_9VIRU|nr:MAG: tRNaseZ [Harvfovirus sp.]